MNFNEYQSRIRKFDTFSTQSSDPKDLSFMSKILGLSGEAGEVAEKFKKIYRDKDGIISDDDKDQIAKELGDVLWYVATISRYLQIPFEDIANQNIKKLTARLENNRLHGSGDDR